MKSQCTTLQTLVFPSPDCILPYFPLDADDIVIDQLSLKLYLHIYGPYLQPIRILLWLRLKRTIAHF